MILIFTKTSNTFRNKLVPTIFLKSVERPPISSAGSFIPLSVVNVFSHSDFYNFFTLTKLIHFINF